MRMFDVPAMQNNLRGLWVEAMIAELLGPGWKYTGGDWAGWDLQHDGGTRLEVKQSAKEQSWGTAKSPPRFDIKAGLGHYPDGINYVSNQTGERLAHFYIFAWHDGTDQRDVGQWQFFLVASSDLPKGNKSIGLNGLRRLAEPVSASELRDTFSMELSGPR
ncbi:hypothetical protein QO034_21655 [Sedimentitalea sp. JM2-8]|uniref:DUF4365 domain-containing protein n=1 Tax=Sedimentitalea xiamensis TaxID=3050037 RepID=A0ABT7FKK1_9RHOB|nr:hypothetical protein [Sedimentitalea xiamensis]MDK3075677.1 hypothetical protein [Sedimentitalea xiamensis]